MSNNGKTFTAPVATADELDDVRTHAMRIGIDIHNPSMARAIQRRRESAALRGEHERNAERAEKLRDIKHRIAGAAGALVMWLSLLTQYVMPPVGIVGLWGVEVFGVFQGVSHWNMPWTVALAMSVTTVSVYVSMLSMRAHVEYGDPRYQWSLGTWARGLFYRLGLGKNWQPRERSEASILDDIIGKLALIIVGLGAAGVLNGIDVAEAVLGAAGRYVLLIALHYLVRFNYDQYTRLITDEELADFFGVQSAAYSSEMADEAELMYLRAKIQEHLEREQQRQT